MDANHCPGMLSLPFASAGVTRIPYVASSIVSRACVQSGLPCPAGAVQFLFKLPDGRKYIHCGDMRFGKHLMDNQHLQRFVGADGVYLDTTYCKTKHQFPPQVPSFLYRSHLHTI